MIYLLTGQPGSGKTTFAKRLIELSSDEWFLIDGDNIREIFNNTDYSRLGRENNISLSYNIAKYLIANNKNVIISLISPYKKMRDEFKSQTGATEIYFHTSEIRGNEQYFVTDYEPPTENFIDICTDNKFVDECIYEIIHKIEDKKWE